MPLQRRRCGTIFAIGLVFASKLRFGTRQRADLRHLLARGYNLGRQRHFFNLAQSRNVYEVGVKYTPYSGADAQSSRYLTKMCDQVTCLISEEHAQSIVWNDESEDAATSGDNNQPRKLYKFTVAKTNEQEETVTPRPGFEVSVWFLKQYALLTNP